MSLPTVTLPWPLIVGVIVLIALAVLTILWLLITARSGEADAPTLSDHFAAYGAMGRALRRSTAADAASLADQARQAATRLLANNRSLEARIAGRLEGAGMSLKPAEWLLLHGAVAIVAGVVGALLGSGSPVVIVLLLALGTVGPWVYLGVRRTRRLAAFNAGLADTLQLMASSLSAGLSLAQSIDTIVREGTEPIASELRRVLVESRLGVPLEDALGGVAQRMSSRDFAWVVMAIRIQRQVGGNLAELLLTVAATLREREYLRRHVRALSAEGRLSCWILGGLPPVFTMYLLLAEPSYVHPLTSTPVGWVMVCTACVLLTVGIFWMSKVAKVDV